MREEKRRVSSTTQAVSPTMISPNLGGTCPVTMQASAAHHVRQVTTLSRNSPSQTSYGMKDAFPTISYSSSEDEDDAEFFDASEYENDNSRFLFTIIYSHIL